MKAYWRNLTKREQVLVSSAAVLLLLTVIYLLIAQPLIAYHTESERAYNRALAQFKAVRTYAGQLQPTADDGPVNQQSVNLRTAISTAARASGVEISRLQPSEDGTLTIWAEQIQSAQLFLWLDTLSKNHTIGPQNILIQKTSVSGNLRVQLQFSSAQR